jgi:hypothetical protein
MNEQGPIPKTVESEITTEQIIALSRKVTVLMTKPENTGTKAPLLLFLKNKGLNALKYRFTLDEDRLNSLYPMMKDWIATVQMATEQHMEDKEVEVFLVTSEDGECKDVREEVLKLRGLDRVASNNPVGTLRNELPGQTIFYAGTEADSTVQYSRNGFHCSTTPEEVLSNLKTFGLLDEAKRLVGVE